MSRVLLAWLLLLCSGLAHAHKPSDAYLQMTVSGQTVRARVDVALRDLDRELVLDQDDNGELSWGEVLPRWTQIDVLVQSRLQLSVGGEACVPGPAGPPQLEHHSDGVYAVLTRQWQCPREASALQVGYQLFADSDPTHRGVLRLITPTGERLQVLVPGAAPAASAASGVAAGPASEAPSGFVGFVIEGMHHILIGTDHVLFLLSLLLPSVLLRVRRNPPMVLRSEWQPAPDGREVLLGVAKVVTAFTVAHSITLALAVLDVFNPPTRWVESLIAASVIATALNNLWPLLGAPKPAAARQAPRGGQEDLGAARHLLEGQDRWKMTFVFGLVHGFGFASVLKDMGLGNGALVSSLLGFNLGVELGQAAVVICVLPLSWWLRGSRVYRHGVLPVGSVLIASVAGIWLAERVFDLKLLGSG
ncbi:HupE/UreJ family protein [Ideonella azotifigens]|uniref:HupE/UreJ family protein n=2 Tax=Ideonella azotifigens TaxID=513160 RepID=A0ABN1KJP2_9BURK|nr:HupE/UreJ family protein [Ideonella azotifigens]MCD2339361.1 HupE/UreJ family protein [Ideonella azotifigens]